MGCRDLARLAPEAFEAALRDTPLVESAGAPGKDAPLWVRLCMFGVPDRAAAKAFYWLFIAGLCASPLLTLRGTMGAKPTALIADAFLIFSAWSTSRAIRWLDEHGWDSLP